MLNNSTARALRVNTPGKTVSTPFLDFNCHCNLTERLSGVALAS